MNHQAPVPLTYDFSGAVIPHTGLSPDDLAGLAPRLEKARADVLDDLKLLRSGNPIPDYKQPLDAGFLDQPERLLGTRRQDLDEIVATAARLREQVDRVVVLGVGGSYMGARALLEAFCHPYHNELPRNSGRPKDKGREGLKAPDAKEERATPRVYFEGDNVDASIVAGLLEMLESDRRDPWAVIPVSKGGGTLETLIAFRLFLDALLRRHKDNPGRVRELVVPVAGEVAADGVKGKLRLVAEDLGCRSIFEVPEPIGGRFSIFTAVGLLPAAVLGIDVVRSLEGAAAMNERFRGAAVGNNPVLDYVGVCHLMETFHGANIRVLATWGKRLEAVGLWYDQLISESLGKHEHGATPLTVVNSRDLHSRGQQHQEGPRDKLITNLIAHPSAADPVVKVPPSKFDRDGLDHLVGKTLPQILEASFQGANEAYRDDGRPTATIRLPAIDETSLGQLFQMLMLATVVEGRLIGVNPYGQPGVEAYKRNMNRILLEEK
jgi:glucose-6-phosphate isomerase